MILKRLLGEIMEEMGFVTRAQLERALRRQRGMYGKDPLPENLSRTQLVAEARQSADSTPLLGQILRDMGFVTDKQLEEALKLQDRSIEIYRSLDSEKLGRAIEIGSLINSTLNLGEVLSIIMKNVRRVIHAVGSTLMLLDDETGELVFSVPTGPKAEGLTDMRLPRDKGIAGWVAQHALPALVPDVSKDPRFYPEVDRRSGLTTKTVLCVPLKARGRLIGVLEVINKVDGTPFNEEDALLLSIFSSQAALAIENARLYSELKDQLEKQRMAEEGKRKLEAELRQAQKMEAIGTLAGGIAHDFNNILSAIYGYTQLALIQVEGQEGAKTKLNEVLKASDRAKELVKQILTFSRQTEQELKPLNVTTVVKEVLKFLRASLPTSVEIRQDIRINSGLVLSDPTQIHQVLMNLCTNAVQAMKEEKGVLEVNIEEVELDIEDVAGQPDLVPGPYIKLSVKDTGHGIDPANMERIFDPYFTTKKKGEGTGLGLSVVMGIVKSHHGMIRVESKPGKGSAFDMLPPKIQNAVPVETEEKTLLPVGNECILMVDDEEVLAKMGQEMLEHLGYRVVVRTSSIEALEAFRANPERFDLVLTDRIMPQMTGFNLAAELREIRPDIPIILCTGFSDTNVMKSIKAMGINEVIMKPVLLDDLARTIREVLDANNQGRSGDSISVARDHKKTPISFQTSKAISARNIDSNP